MSEENSAPCWNIDAPARGSTAALACSPIGGERHTFKQGFYRFKVEGLPGLVISDNAEASLGPAEAKWVTLHVQLPFEASRQVGPGVHPIHFEIARKAGGDGHEVELKEKSTFVIPR